MIGLRECFGGKYASLWFFTGYGSGDVLVVFEDGEEVLVMCNYVFD